MGAVLAMQMESYQNDFRWYATQRLACIDAEYRLAWFRLALIGIYLAVHYWIYSTLAQPSPIAAEFHERLPWYCGVWCIVSFAVIASYHLKWFPTASSFLVVLADIANLTVIASQNGGPNSVVVTCYFVILLTTVLRCNVWLVLVATLFSTFAFLSLVGMTDPIWFDEHHAVPVSVTVITSLSLLSCGAIGGWIVTRIRWIAQHYLHLQAP